MRHYDVIVCSKRVTVVERDTPVPTAHIRATVDGEKYVYQIKMFAMSRLKKGWQERGYVQAYYHAKNAGNVVVFIRTDKPGYPRKHKANPKQMRLI